MDAARLGVRRRLVSYVGQAERRELVRRTKSVFSDLREKANPDVTRCLY